MFHILFKIETIFLCHFYHMDIVFQVFFANSNIRSCFLESNLKICVKAHIFPSFYIDNNIFYDGFSFGLILSIKIKWDFIAIFSIWLLIWVCVIVYFFLLIFFIQIINLLKPNQKRFVLQKLFTNPKTRIWWKKSQKNLFVITLVKNIYFKFMVDLIS